MPEKAHRLLLGEAAYASRLNVHVRTLAKLVKVGSIEPAGQLISGRLVFAAENLSTDYQAASALRRKPFS